MYIPPDYLDKYDIDIDREAILHKRKAFYPRLGDRQLQPYREATEAVQDLRSDEFDAAGSVVKVGRAGELSAADRRRFEAALKTFCPWKKGPFELFGTFIDAEWRSDWKWERILPHISSLKGRKVADIGCHNGYFMFRMAQEKPECVVGFEPYAKHFWNFQLIQNIARRDILHFELLGVEDIDDYRHFFDTIFCLGILYHHTDPIGLLRKMRLALAPKGEIVIDCQGIPGEDAIALTPRKRYANARGIWFLPTQSGLETWMVRAGFANIRPIFGAPLSPEEQRRTPWADIDSLGEFLDPDDRTRTVEGYPAPWRYYLVAGRG